MEVRLKRNLTSAAHSMALDYRLLVIAPLMTFRSLDTETTKRSKQKAPTETQQQQPRARRDLQRISPFARKRD